MSEQYYTLGTNTPEQWQELHAELIADGNTYESVPSREVTIEDEKQHSATRGSYLLTDEEATALKEDPRIKFINIDYSKYPETYKAPPDELYASAPKNFNRYKNTVKVYKEMETSNTLPDSPDATDINRTNWGTLRASTLVDPWIEGGDADSVVKTSKIPQWGDGKHVDVIVADDGAGWIGHPEFNRDTEGEKPNGYTGGNLLPGDGSCDVLDLCLDAPYYLDPDYFDADPDNRLTERWDGTMVPTESNARGWWTSTSNRSSVFNAKFPSAGTTGSIPSGYTRAYCNGTNTSLPNGGSGTVARHCTPCMALTFGRTQGWAYNANKWALNLYGTNGADIEPGFDMQKIFHNTKPINPVYGTQDPTVSSNSWGYRASKGSNPGWYHFREDAPVTYNGTGDEPTFISHMGSQGDTGRWKSEMKTNSLTEALDELCDSGVIFVCAAGNSNQKQTNWGHPDFDNYISANSDDTLEESSYIEFSIEVTGTTNRRGFPQQGGKTTLAAETYTTAATNAGSGAYTLSSGTDRDGAVAGDNASIRIALGDTISITNNASASHPMYFKTVQGSGTGDQVVGATGQGASGGAVISWTPTARGIYYYQCSAHGAMNGTITVVSPQVTYKTINIGALDDDHASGTAKERKVGYSDRGNGIDLYAPADGILSANAKYTPENDYPATYTGFTANSGSGTGVPEDTGFSGTSAACPCAAGFISTLVQFNRDWTYADIKTYLSNMPGQTTDNFYYGTESTTAGAANWTDYPSIETDEAPKVIYQDATQFKQTVFPKRKSSMKSGLRTSGVQINYIQKWDRG